MTSTQTNPAEAPPPVDLRPHAVAYLANNLRTNGYEHHARAMEALAELRAVAEPSAEEAAALYRASMTETKGGFTEAIHHFARVLLSRYGAHKPDGGDAKDAKRYRWLRERDLDVIVDGGVFAGKVQDNVVLNGIDLDSAIDAAMAGSGAHHD